MDDMEGELFKMVLAEEKAKDELFKLQLKKNRFMADNILSMINHGLVKVQVDPRMIKQARMELLAQKNELANARPTMVR